MTSAYDGIPEAWKNDIRFLQTVSELSGLSVAVWHTGKAAAVVFHNGLLLFRCVRDKLPGSLFHIVFRRKFRIARGLRPVQ